MRTLALIYAILFLAAFCYARTITVDDDGPADFDNIQAAIDDANDGDIIIVVDGMFTSQKSSSIDLMDKDIIIRSTDSNVPDVHAPISTDINIVQTRPALHNDYAPNEMIVKFKKVIADKLERERPKNKQLEYLNLSSSLDELNQRFKLRGVKALCRNFRKKTEQIEGLLEKDESLLTKKDKHILRRLKRANRGEKVPALDRIYKLDVELNEGQSLEEVVAAYNNDPDVEYAELNYAVSINLTPNDPLFSVQWPLNNTGQMYPESGRYNPPPGTADCDIDAPEAWETGTGSLEIIAAVVDTGVDYTHRDLQGNLWVNEVELTGDEGADDDGNGYIDDIYGYDFINNDGDPKDDHGHGTHCSGIIAADGNNGMDISGVCWDAKIMCLKFLGANGRGYTSDAVQAFYYAVNNGAEVVSNSWGSSGYSQSIQDAIDYAYSQGVIMVAAAGNTGGTGKRYPANNEHVIAVAATNSNDDKPSFSTYGDWVEIAAPGVDILSLRASGTSMGTVYNSYTTIASGTSMACPHVSGACALLLSLYPGGTVDEVTNILKESADPIGSGVCQSGRLNLDKSILKIVTPEGKMWMNKEVYLCSGTIEIFAADSDLKGAGTEDVSLSTDGNDFETLTLLENGTNTGIFGGDIGLSSDGVVVEDGTLQVGHGQMITATYDDADDGTGNPATVEDTATVDCVIPAVLDVNVTLSLTGRSATVRIETDEPTLAEVSCGSGCGGPYDIIRTDSILSTGHTIKLLPLTSETDYYFVIGLMDVAGNEVVDNNEGQCYWFTTPEFLGFLVPSVYPTIQAAIDDSWDGDTVWVANGIYTGEGNRDIDFLGKAITVRSENGPDNCIIDCNGMESEPHRGFILHNSEDRDSVIDGFTIINGYAPQDGYLAGRKGGAISCDGGYSYPFLKYINATIRNCVLKDNTANLGGGIYCAYGHPQIDNCSISNNSGSGIYAHHECGADIRNCTISHNEGYAVSCRFNWNYLTKIDHCAITDNRGGVYCEWSCSIISHCTIANSTGAGVRAMFSDYSYTVKDCIISNNHSSGVSYNHCSITLSNSIIIGNTSPTNGGGLHPNMWDDEATVKNCVFVGNEAKQRGGAMYSNDGGNTYVNCTIIGNTAGEYGGGYYCQNPGNRYFTNCIFWDNSAPSGPQIAIGGGMADVIISYCDVQGGKAQIPILVGNSSLTWGSGNINSDPCFGLSDDYHLLGNSPCIDAGTNSPTGELPSKDLYGRSRSLDGDGNGSRIVDMGAYEYKYDSSTPVIAISQMFFKFYNFNRQPNPDDQYLLIRNCGGGTLNWQVSDDSFWLEAIPASGSSVGDINEVTIRVDTTTLSHGEYTGKLLVTDSNAINSPREVLVRLHVADTIYVPGEFTTIQEAIDAAGDRSTIIVADGVYTGTGNTNINFNGKAITVKSESGPDNCIIDCENSTRGFIFNTYEEDDSILDGFTIIDGNTSGYGGGISCRNSSPMIINCKVINCQCGGISGGGMYCRNSAVKIICCRFENNTTGREGGGLYFNKGGYALADRCVFYNNTTTGSYKAYGGAICSRNDNGRYATIRNSLIYGNTAGHLGGAIFLTSTSTKIYNCTIANNAANSNGGGIYFDCTPRRTPTLKSSILWGNTPDQIDYSYSVSRIYYNDIQNGWSGRGNINVNPNFVDSANGDYHLRWDSLCIDAGAPGFTGGPNETDIDGEARVIGGRVDMGADEFTITNSAPAACIVGGDQTVEAGVGCEARVTLDGSCSSDADSTPGTNDDIEYFEWYEIIDPCDANSNISLGSDEIIECDLPLGEHIVALEVTDKADMSDTNEVTITVEDMTAPIISLNGSAMVILECGVDSYTEEGATATDNCDEGIAVVIGGDTVDTSTCGTYVVTYDTIDDSGNAAEQVTREVIVEDTLPPEFSLWVEPNVLWPVNHKMVEIRPSWEVSDNCDEWPDVSLVSITMNEDAETKGGGRTIGDIWVDANDGIRLRAERSGKGTGRVYTITYQAVDDSNNITVDSAAVTVPHDMR